MVYFCSILIGFVNEKMTVAVLCHEPEWKFELDKREKKYKVSLLS